MTSHFDFLAQLGGDERESVRALRDAVIDEAVKQIDALWTKGAGLSFEESKKRRGSRDELKAKTSYLSSAHQVLDHGPYHLRCFKPEFIEPLMWLKDNLWRKHPNPICASDRNLKRLMKAYPEIAKLYLAYFLKEYPEAIYEKDLKKLKPFVESRGE